MQFQHQAKPTTSVPVVESAHPFLADEVLANLDSDSTATLLVSIEPLLMLKPLSHLSSAG